MFNGKVNLSAFDFEETGTTTHFNGTATIGNLVLDTDTATLGAIGSADSTVTFKNNMTVGTAGKDGTFTVDTAATTADDNLLLTCSETKGVTVDMTGSLSLQGNTAVEVIGSGTLRHKKAFNNATAIRVREGATLAVDSGAELTAATELSKSSISLDSAEINGSGAQLNANLTLATGAVLNVADGGLAMGSTLTLQEGVLLGDSTLARVQSLSVGESTTLFRGVDGLTLGNTEYTTISREDSILASPYFSNLSNNYVLSYTGTENGSLNITMISAAVPEPTTTTLSLQALSALAARRRRK